MSKSTATKEAVEENAKTNGHILYDAGASQTIPLSFEKTVRRDGRRILQRIRLTHTLNPLTDERYFQLEADIEKVRKRASAVTTAIWEPKVRLWNELIDSVTGYPNGNDPRKAVHDLDKTKAVEALLAVDVLSPETIEYDIETEIIEDAVELDDEDTVIPFRAMHNGALILNMSHSFRAETKAEIDEFLAIEQGQPNTNALASAEKLTVEARLCELGQKLLTDREGYTDDCETPAWHLAATTRAYFARQIQRLGKL